MCSHKIPDYFSILQNQLTFVMENITHNYICPQILFGSRMDATVTCLNVPGSPIVYYHLLLERLA